MTSSDASEAINGDPYNLTTEEAQLIVSMRIYDTLLAIYTELADGTTKADDLMALHAAGRLLGPLPALNVEDLPENGDFLDED